MQHRTLGGELTVSELGLGCMGMSEFYGTTDEDESVATIHRALQLGITLLDTADMYGPFTNERLVGKAVSERREEVVIATKFGHERAEDGARLGVNGRPEYVRRGAVLPGGLADVREQEPEAIVTLDDVADASLDPAPGPPRVQEA